ncbi:hypothetical protein N7492_009187 [Penicillium capsulatum]|uniref:TLDc domain-containing protein n=1 Tax=Penicillium capsulatum TaxID=69766 RepID=A0A9W9HU34_9EURO|nr:hypothetical protein N7492_009187 [Penicillium capsulatum]KAJ6106583.1 hypothetical protein N7512_010100 [Penicillium capsulatum]
MSESLGSNFSSVLKNAWHVFLTEGKTARTYLKSATQESVRDDLQKSLKRRSSEVVNLEEIFHAHAQGVDFNEQPCWNRASFEAYLKKAQPELATSDIVVDLLWRSFHFHSFHPFPRDSVTDAVDLDGFKRAVALLAAQGSDLLGILGEIDTHWQLDQGQNFNHQRNSRRIIRSIGVPPPKDSIVVESEKACILEEIGDVVAMHQPFSLPHVPAERHVFAAAQKLADKDAIEMRRQTSQSDVTTLVSIFLRQRLYKSTWGLSFAFGSFEREEPADHELAATLVNSICSSSEGSLESSDMSSILDLLPNLYLRFYQMWAIIFQPPIPECAQTPSQDPKGTDTRVLRAVSLFVPHRQISTYEEVRREDRRIAVEETPGVSKDASLINMNQLARALAGDECAHVVLVRGKNSNTSQFTVIGSYFPRDRTGAGIHAFFQLQPRFCVLRWTGGKRKNARHIVSANDESCQNSIGSGKDDDSTGTGPFWIGDPDGNGVCMKIEPENRSASVVCLSDVMKPMGAAFGDVQVSVDHITVLDVSGSEPAANANTPGNPYEKPKTTEGSTENRIQGEELRRRIMGFGST